MYFSKSKYCRLWQCEKQLWLYTNYLELQLDEPPREDRITNENEVGDKLAKVV